MKILKTILFVLLANISLGQPLINNNETALLKTENSAYTVPFNSFSMNFDGIDELINVGTSPFFENSSTEFSVSAWIFTNNTKFNGTVKIFVDESIANPGGGGFWLGVDDRGGLSPTNGIRCTIGTLGGVEITITNNNVIGAVDNWYHVIFTYDKTSGVGKIFINGIDATASSSGGSGDFVPRNLNMTFGAANNSSFNFNGNIDEVVIWDKDLTDAESLELFNIYTGTFADIRKHSAISNSIGWWRMGDKSTWDGTNHTLIDQILDNDGVSTNQDLIDKQYNVPNP